MKKQGFTVRNIWTWSAAAAAVATLAGCAHLGAGSTPEQAVQKRSDAYWQARLSGDVPKAYSFMAPGYRSLNSERKYRQEYGVVPNLEGGDISAIKCSEPQQPEVAQRCVVSRSFTTTPPMMSGMQVPIGLSETWIKEDGRWWLFLD